MANEADQASELEELFLTVSLANSRSKMVDSPVAKGVCLYCDERLAPPLRWCDKDCRDDWQRLENSSRQKKGQSLLTAEMLGD